MKSPSDFSTRLVIVLTARGYRNTAGKQAHSSQCRRLLIVPFLLGPAQR